MRLHLTCATVAIFLLTGCHRSVDLFQLSVGTASAGSAPDQVIGLREEPPLRLSEEGYLLPGTGATPLYSLEDKLEVPDGGLAWSFTIRDVDRPLTIKLFAADGGVVGARSFFPGVSPDGPVFEPIPDHLVVVPTSGDASVGAFQISGGTHDGQGPVIASSNEGFAEGQIDGPRLVGVWTSPPSGSGDSGISLADDVLVIGTGVKTSNWRYRDGERLAWSVTTEPAVWPPLAPVEITYRFAPIPPPEDLAMVGEAPPTDPVAPTVELTIGAAELVLALRPGENRAVVYPEVYGALATDVTIRSAVEGFSVAGICPLVLPGNQSVSDVDAPTGAVSEMPVPLPADLGTVFDYPMGLWRSEQFELFRWTLHPDVLVMDTRDYSVQSRFFKRLAFFTEKEGFRGRILTDAELGNWHGYNAHNYSPEGLSAFFDAVEVSGVTLTDEEILLRELVVREGLVTRSGDGFLPGRGGILSISQESSLTPGLRLLLLTHEACHGVFYASEPFADGVGELWRSISNDEQRFWSLLLDGMQYDIADPGLVVNEFQAYLLQQPPSYATWYFEVRSAERLRGWKPHESQWIDQFLSRNAGAFQNQAFAASDLLFSTTGLVGGDVFCVKRSTR